MSNGGKETLNFHVILEKSFRVTRGGKSSAGRVLQKGNYSYSTVMGIPLRDNHGSSQDKVTWPIKSDHIGF